MTHLTLNTGDSHDFDQTSIPRNIVRQMAVLLPDGGNLGKCAPELSAFRVTVTHDPGVTAFTVWRGQEPLVMNVVCRDKVKAEDAWTTIEKTYLELSDYPLVAYLGTALPDMPARAPWLATILLPSIAALTRDDISWLGDFEQCMAVTILSR